MMTHPRAIAAAATLAALAALADRPAQAAVVALSVDVGLATGFNLPAPPERPKVTLPTPSPTIAGDFEFGSQWGRLHLGLQTAPFFDHPISYDEYTAPVAMAVTGFVVGSPEVYGGPFVAAGWSDFEIGLRFCMLPWGLQGKNPKRGLEFRAALHPGTIRLDAMFTFAWSPHS